MAISTTKSLSQLCAQLTVLCANHQPSAWDAQKAIWDLTNFAETVLIGTILTTKPKPALSVPMIVSLVTATITAFLAPQMIAERFSTQGAWPKKVTTVMEQTHCVYSVR